MEYAVKVILSAVLIVLVSETGKRSSLLGGILASLPLVSVLAMVWLYAGTGDPGKVSALARSIFWLVIPSLALFIALPVLLDRGTPFYTSMALSIAVTVACYYLMVFGLKAVGVHL